MKRRRIVRRRDGAAALSVVLWFCLSRVAVAAGFADDSLVRGFVQTGDASGIWTLRRCGDGLDVPIKDNTPGEALTVAVAEIKRAMQNPRRGVFVEFHGTVLRHEAVAKRLWRVLGYVVDCTKAPDNVAADAKFWASGNEPAWRVVVRGKQATLTRFGREPVQFAAAPFTPQPARRSYEAQTGSTRLRIEINEELCLDTMAETAYGARVTATVREKGSKQALQGCGARY